MKAYDQELEFQWDELENQEVMEKLLHGALDAGFLIGAASRADLASKTVYHGKMNAIVYSGQKTSAFVIFRISR